MVKVYMDTGEWGKAKAKYPELAELEGDGVDTLKPETTHKSKGYVPEIYYEEKFMYRTHEIKNWLLLPLIIFAVVGFGVTVWQVVLHWVWVAIGIGVVGAIFIAVKTANRED